MLARNLLLIPAASTIVACTFRPEIISAWVQPNSNGDATIYVRLKRQDAATIKRRQLYVAIAVVNCDGDPEKYPIEPYIAGDKVTHFKFPLESKEIDLTGVVPAKIFREYERPCVFLEGGGYFTGKIKTSLAPLITSLPHVPRN